LSIKGEIFFKKNVFTPYPLARLIGIFRNANNSSNFGVFGTGFATNKNPPKNRKENALKSSIENIKYSMKCPLARLIGIFRSAKKTCNFAPSGTPFAVNLN